MTGIIRERDLDITRDQLDKWQNGMLIQDAFPNLSPDDREFIMTGITEEEWDKLSEDTQSVQRMKTHRAYFVYYGKDANSRIRRLYLKSFTIPAEDLNNDGYWLDKQLHYCTEPQDMWKCYYYIPRHQIKFFKVLS